MLGALIMMARCKRQRHVFAVASRDEIQALTARSKETTQLLSQEKAAVEARQCVRLNSESQASVESEYDLVDLFSFDRGIVSKQFRLEIFLPGISSTCAALERTPRLSSREKGRIRGAFFTST